jgi:hypothetical protein
VKRLNGVMSCGVDWLRYPYSIHHKEKNTGVDEQCERSACEEGGGGGGDLGEPGG